MCHISATGQVPVVHRRVAVWSRELEHIVDTSDAAHNPIAINRIGADIAGKRVCAAEHARHINRGAVVANLPRGHVAVEVVAPVEHEREVGHVADVPRGKGLSESVGTLEAIA